MRRSRPRVSFQNYTLITTDDGSRTLFCDAAGESYHSESGAVAEAEHVFVRLSAAPQRLQAGGGTLEILEVGFGTGLNFLLTANYAVADVALRYCAVESTPLPGEVFQEMGFKSIVDDPRLVDGVAKALAVVADRRRRSVTQEITPRVTLDLRVGDACGANFRAQQFDIVYHDAFSPAANPLLWEPRFLQQLFNTLRPGGCLVTYCVRSIVQRSLKEAGFAVEKHPGPVGGKREVLRAIKER